MKQKRKIKIGVVGTGHLGNYHLQKYQKISDCEIVCTADIIRESSEKAAGTYNCEALFDHRGLIGRVDAASVAAPTGFHYEVAKDLLSAGIDVLLEKPICVTLEEADDLISIAESKGAIFQIGFVERFNPAIAALEKVIEAPLFIESHRLHPFFERGTDVDVILDLMIHDLDIILNFVKSPVKNVEAVGVSVLSNEVDISNARITFQNGCVANITASRVTGKVMQKIRFFGPEGYHSIDYGKRKLVSLGRKSGADGQIEIGQNNIEVEVYDPLEREIRAFIDSVITRRTPLVTGRDGRKSLDLALRIIDKMNDSVGEIVS
ncbi:MAG: Gfo/Idh/MocA family oxidoreductase [Deltaproteobacteria bacterium]|nr:Gfo/Idh/MocA family oxidoreductase [Deltaproteobacteria bacterium]